MHTHTTRQTDTLTCIDTHYQAHRQTRTYRDKWKYTTVDYILSFLGHFINAIVSTTWNLIIAHYSSIAIYILSPPLSHFLHFNSSYFLFLQFCDSPICRTCHIWSENRKENRRLQVRTYIQYVMMCFVMMCYVASVKWFTMRCSDCCTEHYYIVQCIIAQWCAVGCCVVQLIGWGGVRQDVCLYLFGNVWYFIVPLSTMRCDMLRLGVLCGNVVCCSVTRRILSVSLCIKLTWSTWF